MSKNYKYEILEICDIIKDDEVLNKIESVIDDIMNDVCCILDEFKVYHTKNLDLCSIHDKLEELIKNLD